MLRKLISSLCLCLSVNCAEGIEIRSENPHAMLYSRPGAGMFSVFSDVLILIHAYEAGYYSGVSVDFGTTGLYYDVDYGPNWWEYYCEPIRLGDITQTPTNVAFLGYLHMSFQDAHRMLKEHIHIKPHIQTKIDSFINDHFHSSTIIGVHYRGTDKSIEAPRTQYEYVFRDLIEHIVYYGLKDYQIFIATDEIPFLDYMEKQFPGKIIYCEDVLRSVDDKHPVHLNAINPYKRGEEALIDCVLLSKCSWLYRTPSNLSFWSSLFNPWMPVSIFRQQ